MTAPVMARFALFVAAGALLAGGALASEPLKRFVFQDGLPDRQMRGHLLPVEVEHGEGLGRVAHKCLLSRL